VEFLRRADIPLDDTAAEADDAWKLLMASATDAEAAERGAVSLAPSVSPQKPIEQVLRDDYDERRLSTGPDISSGVAGRQPLVVINASGVPAGLWTQLLADESDHFRILLCESRASDLLAGGLHTDTTAEMDAADAALAVRQEGFDRVDVLAWCNGHLPAIELTGKTTVDSVVLLAPSFFTCDERFATVYGRKILGMLDVVRREPAMTSALCKFTLAQVTASAADPAKSGLPVWSLPDRAAGFEIASPMSTASSLARYAGRQASDTTYPLRQKLAGLTNRLMVITGNDDHIASDAAATELLAATGVRNTVSAWLPPDIIFRTFNTAICAPYSNHSLSIAANPGLWPEPPWLPPLPESVCIRNRFHCIPTKELGRAAQPSPQIQRRSPDEIAPYRSSAPAFVRCNRRFRTNLHPEIVRPTQIAHRFLGR